METGLSCVHIISFSSSLNNYFVLFIPISTRSIIDDLRKLTPQDAADFILPGISGLESKPSTPMSAMKDETEEVTMNWPILRIVALAFFADFLLLTIVVPLLPEILSDQYSALEIG